MASVILGGSWYTLPLPGAAEAGWRRGSTPPDCTASSWGRFSGRRRLHSRSGGGGPSHCGLGGSHRAGRDGWVRLAPPSIEDVLAVADSGETLPAKTTYATPKPLAGLVVRLIEAR